MRSFGAMQLLALILCGAAPLFGNDIDYLRDVKPILEHKCYACHGALKQQSSALKIVCLINREIEQFQLQLLLQQKLNAH